MGLLTGIKNNIIILGIVSFLTDVSSEMIFPILPVFLTTILGVGTGIVGLIEGIADSASSLLDIFVGYFSDNGHRKRFVIAGYGLSSISKQAGAAMSSRLMAPKTGEMRWTVSMISLGSRVFRHKGNASIPANSLKIMAFPSMTGKAASGPRSPSPSTAEPSVTIATQFALMV